MINFIFVFVPRGSLPPTTSVTIREPFGLVYGAVHKQHDSWIMFEKLFAESGLSLDRLKAFADIVAAGGMTAAAGDDSNRQSQLSRQLKELERYFGAELIKRGRGPMKLTEAGQQLHHAVCHSFSALEEFRQTCVDQPVELMIGAGESLIQWMLLPRSSKLLRDHPRLVVCFQNLRNEDILRQVTEGTLDFGVVSRFAPDRRLESAPLGKLDFVLFVPRKFIEGKRPSVEILDRVPLALLRGSETIHHALEEAAAKHNFKLDVRLRLSSYPQLAEAVQRLEVAAVMPGLAGPALPQEQVAMVRLPILDALSRQLSLVWSRKMAEVRPAIAAHAKILALRFDNDF